VLLQKKKALKAKDRSLRQLLQGLNTPNVGAAAGCDLLILLVTTI
jgi:hypothetical protein